MNKIYLDHSATTPIDPKVLKTMLPYFKEKFGNPSSIHDFGREAIKAIDHSREEIAKFLNTSPEEIIFTSGATESNNLAILGFLKYWKNLKIKPYKKAHFITSIIEHDSVREPFSEIEKEKDCEITYLPVQKNGVIDLKNFENSIKDNTVFISIMYVNSEVGAKQPIREIGKIIKKRNKVKENEWKKTRVKNRGPKPHKIFFHTDATQAVNFFNCNTKFLHTDMLSLSGHKFYGPKGVGALFVKKNTPIKSIQLGGHHEMNLRSGTLNTPGIIGIGKAINLVSKEKEKNFEKTYKLRNYFIDNVKKNFENIILNTDINHAAPSHAHISFPGAEGESILVALDLENIAVSTGSACASANLKASHVLVAMGIRIEIAHTSIRFTFGKNNTKKEIDNAIKKLTNIIKRIRKINPLYNKK